MRAFIFPGQGSQSVGMGTALAAASREARAVFEEVDEALGQNLSRLMAEGPVWQGYCGVGAGGAASPV